MRADGSQAAPGEPERTSGAAARAERYRNLSRAAALLVLVAGGAVLAGWTLDIEELKRIQPGYVAMPPLTAIGLVVSGISLLLLGARRPRPSLRGAGTVLAGLVMLLGVLAAVQHLTGADPAAARLPFQAAVEADPAAPDPWPAPTTGAAFVFTGLALLLLAVRVRRRFVAAQLLALAVAFIAVHGLILYIYDIGVLLGLVSYPAMALHAAAALLVVSLGLLLAQPGRGIMRTVTADDLGGHMARKVLPVALVAPLLFGLVRALGVATGLFGAVRGLALVLAFSVAAFVALVWWAAATVHRLDAGRLRALARAEAARAAREQAAARLRLALEAGRMGTWEWSIRTGSVDWSRELEAIHGLEPGSFPGTVEAFWQEVHPDGRARVRSAIERALHAGEPYHIEYRAVRPDGAVLWLEAWGRVFRTPAGEPERMVGVCRDVTLRVAVYQERERLLEREREARAEAEAARSEAERHAQQEAALRRAAEGLTATYVTDEVIRRIAETALAATGADGAFVLRLDRESRELRVAAAGGANVPALGERFPFHGSATERVLERGGPEALDPGEQAERLAADEVRRSCPHCHAIIVPLVDSGQQIGSLILVRLPRHGPFAAEELERAATFAHLASLALRKIYLLEDAERRREELEQLLESRGRLMRGFSHDVKNPLGAAEGQLALLEQGVPDALAPRPREGVARARRSIRTALRLIDSLVELARAEAGRLHIEQAPTDVRGVAHEIVEEYRTAAERKGVAFGLRLAGALPVIHSDVDRIRQILANLVVNAVKYTARGRITVTAELREADGRAPGPGRWVVVEVSDTGPGIPEDKQEDVFGEFTRLEPGAGKGAGLGLAISRRLARLLGGDVTLQSEVGRGSSFTLWLPQNRPASVGPGQAETRAPADGEDRHPAPPPGVAADGAEQEPRAKGRTDGGEPGESDEAARLRALVEQQERELEEHRLLAGATATLASSLGYEESLERLAQLAVPRLADLCVVDVLVEQREIRCVAAVHRDPAQRGLAERLKEFPTDSSSTPVARALLTRRPQIVREVSDAWLRSAARSPEHLEVLRALRPSSAILVPLVARGRMLGLLILARTVPAQPYDEEDLRLAEELGRRAAVIIDNARLYEAAQTASEAKSDFLAVMSHELRTPLTAIIGYQELLGAGIAGSVTDEQMRYLRRIGASALHLRELIEEILTFSRLVAGREEVRLERTDLALLARDTADVVEPAAREKGVTFDVVLPAEPVDAWTDPPKVRRILLNLLNNSVSFTDRGRIRLALERERGMAVFRIEDTGIGIATESFEKVFEPFWQEQRGLTREVGGTGLGLTVARRLARMLGGDVTVESEIGKGSTFTLRLPLRPPSPPDAAGTQRRASRGPSG